MIAFLTTYDPSAWCYGIACRCCYPYCPARVVRGVCARSGHPRLQTRERGRMSNEATGVRLPRTALCCPRLAGRLADTLARMELAYQEIQRRDSPGGAAGLAQGHARAAARPRHCGPGRVSSSGWS